MCAVPVWGWWLCPWVQVPPLSWCGGGWWCLSPPFLANGLLSFVAVFGGSPPILVGCLGAVSCYPSPGVVLALFGGCVVGHCPWVGGGVWSVFWCLGQLGWGGMLVWVLGSGGWLSLRGLLLGWP